VEIANKGFGSRHPNYAPVVSNDGTKVYFQSKEGLWALDPTTGAAIWLFVPDDREEIKSAPSIGADGTIYIGASKKKSRHVYALDPADGSITWEYAAPNKGKFSNNQAAIGADGKVYIGLGKVVFCLDGAGNGDGTTDLLWALPLPGKIDAGVVIGDGGSLYVGAGKNLWKITD
jgi:outer membrane protein assembly factor BamB